MILKAGDLKTAGSAVEAKRRYVEFRESDQ